MLKVYLVKEDRSDGFQWEFASNFFRSKIHEDYQIQSETALVESQFHYLEKVTFKAHETIEGLYERIVIPEKIEVVQEEKQRNFIAFQSNEELLEFVKKHSCKLHYNDDGFRLIFEE